MNEKLTKKFTFTDLVGTTSAGHRGSGPLDALVHLHNGTTKGKDSLDILRVSFHTRVKQLTGWAVGDTLNLSVDGTACCVFRDAKGRCLSTQSKDSKRLSVRFAMPKGTLPEMHGAGTKVETLPGRIAFEFPQA